MQYHIEDPGGGVTTPLPHPMISGNFPELSGKFRSEISPKIFREIPQKLPGDFPIPPQMGVCVVIPPGTSNGFFSILHF